MHLSHEARAYKADAFQRAGVNGAPIFPTGDVSVVIVWRRTMKAGDLDKRLGVLLDALQSIRKRVPDHTAPGKTRLAVVAPGVYDSDAQVAMIFARRCDAHEQLEPGTVRVEVSQTPCA